MPEPPALVEVSPGGLTLEEASRRLCRLAPPPLHDPLERLRAERILVTGAAGSIGTAARRALGSAGIEPLVTDLPGLDGSRPLDVRDRQAIEDVWHLPDSGSASAAEPRKDNRREER